MNGETENQCFEGQCSIEHSFARKLAEKRLRSLGKKGEEVGIHIDSCGMPSLMETYPSLTVIENIVA
jgi:hypothetical protein